MSEKKAKTYLDFVLPTNVVTKVDVSRLVSEAEWVDNEMTTAAVRSKAGAKRQAEPVMSDQLIEFIDQNHLELDSSRERTDLVKQLRLLKNKVPVVHMTFASTADRESLERLAEWLRKSVHPQAIISVGLQPALVGGAYIRTPNHVHDFSIRGMLEGHHDLLAQELGALRGSK